MEDVSEMIQLTGVCREKWLKATSVCVGQWSPRWLVSSYVIFKSISSPSETYESLICSGTLARPKLAPKAAISVISPAIFSSPSAGHESKHQCETNTYKDVWELEIMHVYGKVCCFKDLNLQLIGSFLYIFAKMTIKWKSEQLLVEGNFQSSNQCHLCTGKTLFWSPKKCSLFSERRETT